MVYRPALRKEDQEEGEIAGMSYIFTLQPEAVCYKTSLRNSVLLQEIY